MPTERRPGVAARQARPATKYGLRLIALGYLGVLLALPLAVVIYRMTEEGLGATWDAATTPAAISALKLTLIIALIAVPLNAVFGVMAALMLVRKKIPARPLVSALIDLPLALSPIVVGLSLLLVWGQDGWLFPISDGLGIQVIFALPSMILATIFVSLPFVVREVVPVLREIGTDQEEAAAILGAGGFQTFWRITLPAIRWGLIYGVILTTARSIGEYGAVAVVSGKIAGRTETLTLHVEERYLAFDTVAAYTSAALLAVIALVVVLLMNILNRKGGGGGHHGV